MSDAPSPFYEGTRLQRGWDSTSLGWLKHCSRHYQYKMIEGWSSRGSGLHLFFGQVYHSAIETFDRVKAEGGNFDDCLDAAVAHVLSETWVNGAPWNSGDTSKNRDTLLRSIIWYYDQFRDDPAQTVVLANGRPAVELSFRFELDLVPAGFSEPFLLSGHIDRLVTFAGDTYAMDHKTTKQTLSDHYFSQYNPDNQMCQPPETIVLTENGEKTIAEITSNDKVICPHRSGKELRSERVIATSSRPYAGNLIVLQTKYGSHRVTPNHRCIVRLSDSCKNYEAVYLMRKGNRYRIGITSLRTRRDFKNGLSQRCRLEQADAMWLLAVTPDREEAWAIEQMLSVKYGIPAFTFLNKSYKNFSETKQFQLNWLWSVFDNNIADAIELLNNLGQDINYPIYEVNSGEELAFTRKSFVYAANLNHNIFEVAVLIGNDLIWVPLTVGREPYEGLVYSLEVETNESTLPKGSYIANGILTGNSLYTLATQVIYETNVKGVIIDAAQIAVGFSRFQRGITYRTPEQLNEWLATTKHYLLQAQRYADEGFWPMNDKACFNCEFRRVCSADPRMRQTFLESDFDRSEPWNPLKAR